MLQLNIRLAITVYIYLPSSAYASVSPTIIRRCTASTAVNDINSPAPITGLPALLLLTAGHLRLSLIFAAANRAMMYTYSYYQTRQSTDLQ